MVSRSFLFFFVTGKSEYSLGRQFRVDNSSVNTIIASHIMRSHIIHCTENRSDKGANDIGGVEDSSFGERRNFPTCVGGIDGKHVAIVKPAKSGSRTGTDDDEATMETKFATISLQPSSA